MSWIPYDDSKPTSPFHVVLVTDGECVWLARWIEDPADWYGADLCEWDDDLDDEVPLDQEWHTPHWLYIQEIGPFNGNHECFGEMEGVSHWMNLPLPPGKNEI